MNTWHAPLPEFILSVRPLVDNMVSLVLTSNVVFIINIPLFIELKLNQEGLGHYDLFRLEYREYSIMAIWIRFSRYKDIEL